MKKYIAYHCHSDLSNLTVADSSVSPMDYINRIKDLGHTTYVSTEHGQSYGWAEKYLLCEKHNIKFVYGVEIYLEHNKKPYHCILVAKNFEGLKQINHAINDAVRNNFVNRRPRVTMEMIEKYIDRNNVYCTTACFVKGTKVETKDGIKNIEKVQSGDYVLTHNNTWEEVNFPTTRHYCGDMITLGVDRTNKRITSTANHKYYTLDKKTSTPQWKEANELSVGDILLTAKDNVIYTYDKQLNFNTEKRVSKCKLKHCNTSIVLDEIDMITFGLWIGDGYISATTSNYRVGFTFNIKEFDNYYESFVKKTMDKFKIEPYININKDSNKVEVTYYSKTLYYVFRDLFGKVNSETKAIPKKLMHISKEYDTAILFGYLLADGYFGYDRNKGGSVRSITISEKLHTQIKSIYKTLGAFPSEFVKNEYVDKNNVNHRQSYYLILHNAKLSKISKMGDIEFQYNLFKENINKTSTSKIILEINGREYFARKVKSIDKSKFDGSVYCLNVGASHSFHCEDIIVHNCIMGILSEPTSELFRSVLRHFGDSTLLEVQANLDERQISINKLAKMLSKRYNLKLIAGTDSHIIDNKQIIERADLIAGKGINYGEDESEDGFFMDYPDHDTLFQRFKKQGVFSDDEIKDFIDRTNIFEMCDSIVLNKDFKVPSIYPELSRKERCQKLIALINKKWNEYKVNVPTELHPKYIQEIKNELKEWFACHMEDYALTSHAIVKRGVRKGGVITTTGRGSCASYLTNMLLGFTTIDRLRTKIPILQQRFMTADKILKSHSCPDIDNNVAKIDAFVEAQEEILGENNSFPLVAFGTLKAKSAFKMLCKVKGDIPIDLQNEMSLKITEYEIDLKHAEDDERENIKLEDYLKDPELKKLYDDGSSYFGLRTDLKRHASAFCIADHDVSEIFGLCKTPGGDIVLNLEGKYMDELGYVKLDWLIVNVVELIDVVYKEIGIPTPTSRQLEDWVDNDDKVWDIYKNGITCCVNQVEQLKTRDKVMKYLPTTKEELAAIIAGVRPGFQSYYKRFENREKFNFGLPSLDDLLKGEFLDSPWMLYQEQIMLLVIWLGFEVSQSADLMKAISKKSQDKIDKIKPVFQERCIAEFVKAGVDKGEAQHRVDSIWQVIEDAANYMFNASHAYEMALDSLYLAYAKAHYPKQTYTALIRYWSEHKKVDKIYKLKVEAKKHFGFDIAPFKFRQDNRSVHMIGDTIYQSLTGVKNLNSSVGEAMYELRDYQGDYLGLRDLMIDKKLDKTHRETLIKIGYFEEFGSMGSLLWIEENYKECKIIRLDNLKKMYNELSSEITVPYDDFEKDIFNICEKRTNAQFRMKDSKDFFKYLLTVVNINDIISMNKIFFEISLLGTTTYEHGHVGIVEQVNKNGSILFSDVRTNDFKKYKLKNKNMNVSEKDIIYFNKVEENNWKWFKKDGSYLEGTSYIITNIVNLTTLFKKAKKKKGEDENE